MDTVVQIIGIAARFLTAAGVPPVAVWGACVVLALLYVLAPKAWGELAERVKAWKPEPGGDVDEGGKVIDFKTRTGVIPRDPSDGMG